jgi:hypothetical protein
MKVKAIIEEVIIQPNKIQPIIGKIIILLTLFLSSMRAYVYIYMRMCMILYIIYLYLNNIYTSIFNYIQVLLCCFNFLS